MNTKLEIDTLLDEYAAGKKILKSEKNKDVKGYVRRVVLRLKELGFTTEQIKKKTKKCFE